MTTYAEVARAESERGELVLRRRSSPQAADVLELRVNGVFVMDTQETSSEEEMAALALGLVEEPTLLAALLAIAPREAADRVWVEVEDDDGRPRLVVLPDVLFNSYVSLSACCCDPARGAEGGFEESACTWAPMLPRDVSCVKDGR